MENNVQRVLAKERVSQSKALDLQSQLNRAKTEQSQLKRSKDEVCGKSSFNYSFKSAHLWVCLCTTGAIQVSEALSLSVW